MSDLLCHPLRQGQGLCGAARTKPRVNTHQVTVQMEKFMHLANGDVTLTIYQAVPRT